MARNGYARDWLGTKEAAAYLAVSVWWLYDHTEELPPNYVVGGGGRGSVRRYLRSDLDAWIERQKPQPHDLRPRPPSSGGEGRLR